MHWALALIVRSKGTSFWRKLFTFRLLVCFSVMTIESLLAFKSTEASLGVHIGLVC